MAASKNSVTQYSRQGQPHSGGHTGLQVCLLVTDSSPVNIWSVRQFFCSSRVFVFWLFFFAFDPAASPNLTGHTFRCNTRTGKTPPRLDRVCLLFGHAFLQIASIRPCSCARQHPAAAARDARFLPVSTRPGMQRLPPLTFSSALLWHSVVSSVRVSLSAVTQQLKKPSRRSSSALDDVG